MSSRGTKCDEVLIDQEGAVETRSPCPLEAPIWYILVFTSTTCFKSKIGWWTVFPYSCFRFKLALAPLTPGEKFALATHPSYKKDFPAFDAENNKSKHSDIYTWIKISFSMSIILGNISLDSAIVSPLFLRPP